MSDGPSKLAPGAQVLDEVSLGDSERALPEVVAKKAVSSPPRPSVAEPPRPRHGSVVPADGSAKRASQRPSSDADLKDTKKRGRMTLRIPDDEVVRPKDPPSGRDLSDEIMTPLQPSRIIAINAEPSEPSHDVNGAEAKSSPALGIDHEQERGWTPYQPPVAPQASPLVAPHVPSSPIAARSAPVSEEIPIDFTTDPDVVAAPDTAPRAPVFDSARAFDSEEIRLDDVDGERATDPGASPEAAEEAEVSVDDLVSVDSAPTPRPRPVALASAQPSSPAAVAPAPASASAQPSSPVVTPAAAPSPVTPSLSPSPVSVPNVAVAAPSSPVLAGAPVLAPPVGAFAPPPMSEAAATRKKGKPWWEELFNDDFIRTQVKLSDADISREVDFIEDSLGCEAGATLLDLACGTGRHAVDLASRGYQVVGFDLSLAMLARASDEAQDRKQKINFVQGDMREMQFEEAFDGIFAWNTSFGFFDEEKNNAVIARVHRALKKGGQFLLDVANRDYLVRQAPSLAWFEGDGCICMDEMQIDFITSRMRVKRTLMMDDGRTKEIEYSIRLYSLHELGKMLHDNGFRVAEVSGRTSTPGVFFGCESPRTLILAEKR